MYVFLVVSHRSHPWPKLFCLSGVHSAVGLMLGSWVMSRSLGPAAGSIGLLVREYGPILDGFVPSQLNDNNLVPSQLDWLCKASASSSRPKRTEVQNNVQDPS